MNDTAPPRHAALQGRMLDVQENLLEFFSASALESALGWEDVHIERPEPAPQDQRPVLRLVA